jgi:citrate lyase subunit beta/citryl-CoA lyase
MTVQWPTAPLFVPAHKADLRAKAIERRYRALILDLEDAVPPDQKTIARDAAKAFVLAHPNVAFVRVNPLNISTAFSLPFGEDDIAAVVQHGLVGVILPKVEASADVITADHLISGAERSQGIVSNTITMVALIESARGISMLSEITSARITRPWCLAFGAADFTTDIGVTWSPDELESQTARALLVIASRAAGLPPPIDSAYPDIKNIEHIRASALRARAAGFGAKFAIHPVQVGTFEAAFNPAADEIAWADKVLAGLSKAESQGAGAFTVDGRLVDYPIVERARRIRAQASVQDLIGTRSGERVKR